MLSNQVNGVACRSQVFLLLILVESSPRPEKGNSAHFLSLESLALSFIVIAFILRIVISRLAMKILSDLEHTMLGIVFKRGPCTPYIVAREFINSPSSHWRGSAGSVYPAITRLHRLGLLKKTAGKSLGRRCSLFSLSPKGLKQLQSWLTPPLPESAASITFDPLRTRSFFLTVLSPELQLAFLHDAEKQLQSQIPVLKAECQKYRETGDWYSEQAQVGGLIVAEARLDWVRQYRRALQTRTTSLE